MPRTEIPRLLAVTVSVAGVLAAGRFVQAAGFDQSHTVFDGVLKQYVTNGRVEYVALKSHPEKLNRYLGEVAKVSEFDFTQWGQSQQLAFVINAYNAYTLKLILDHYPIASIKDIGHFWSGPWDQPVVQLFGKRITLNALEHGILRKNYSEPRIHFALVCAAKGCPPLRREAYVASRMNEQLDDQARRFLADDSKNHVDVAHHMVFLSPIFKWYAEDFARNSGSVLEYIQPYWPKGGRDILGKMGYKHLQIRYTVYNWSLNEQKK
jgi:hypothetical protein